MTIPPDLYEFEGFQHLNGTIVPDVVFDVLMPNLKDGELRVLLYIIRRTYGFKKASDNISLSQMVAGITKLNGEVLDGGTGLKKSAVAEALKGLRRKKIIKVIHNTSAARGHEPTTYQLRFKGEAVEETVSGSNSRTDFAVPLSGYTDKGLSGSVDKGLSGYTDIQQTVLQTTDINLSNIRMRSHAKLNVDNSGSQPSLPHRNSTASVDETAHTNIAPSTVARDDTALLQAEETIRRFGMEGIGDILKRGKGRPTKQYDEERSMILAFIGDFAREFADQAQLKSSVTRALNIYKESGLSPALFQDRMYQARVKTKERRAAIKGSRMAYFFACLEQEAGLREAPERGSSDSPRVLNR